MEKQVNTCIYFLSATDNTHLQSYFPSELRSQTDAQIMARRNALVNQVNALNNIPPTTSFNEVMDKYNALSNDALRVLAALPGNEAAFTQLTIQALDQKEPDPEDATKLRWRNRVGPDNASDFVVDIEPLSIKHKESGSALPKESVFII